GGVRGGEQQPRAEQFQVQARAGGAGHLGQRLVGDVGAAAQFGVAEQGRLLVHPVQLVLGQAAEDLGGVLGQRLDDDQVAEALEQVLDEAARVVSGLDDPVDRGEDGGGVLGGHGVDDVVQQGGVRVAEQGDGELVVQ